jgi:hypothetical protein
MLTPSTGRADQDFEISPVPIATLQNAVAGIVFPFYALAQVLVMPPLGALKYIELVRQRRRVGRYRVGYRREAVLRDVSP